MSATLATQRRSIVEVLSTVAGVAATPTTPQTIVAGSAWPVWRDLDWVTVADTAARWQVFVVLPNTDPVGTVDAADTLLQPVADALRSLGKVGPVDPVQWAVEPGQQSVPALRFNLEV